MSWQVKVDFSDLSSTIAVFTSEKLNTVIKAIKLVTREVAGKVRRERLTGGTTDRTLAVRTGRLRASFKEAPVKVISTTLVEGGLQVGTVYSRVHINRKGTVTTITPKKAKMLAIPLQAAKTSAGVVKGSPRGGPWGETFIRRTKSGHVILFGKLQITKGPRTGKLRGGVVPLFLLVDYVKIKARVFVEDIEDELIKRLTQRIKEEGATVIRKGTF